MVLAISGLQPTPGVFAMSIRTSLVPLACLLAGLGGTFAAAVAGESAVIEAREPLQATLLPTVTVVADPADPDGPVRWHVDAAAPLPVTLMPTVHVTAHAEPASLPVLPTVTVVADRVPPLQASVASTQPVESAIPYESLPQATDSRQDLWVWLMP
jgi:hypothetical protein